MSYPKVYRDIFENEGAGPLFRSDRIPPIKADGLAYGAVTPEKLSQDYLPTTGGTMIGSGPKIIFNQGAITTAEGINAQIGLSANSGARLALWTGDSPTNTGSFHLSAKDPTGEKVLSGNPAGELLWDERPVLSLVMSWRDNHNWYRKYSDGRIEQGGRATSNSKVTFNVPFTESRYTLVTQVAYNSGEESGFPQIDSFISKTSFYLAVFGANGSKVTVDCWWYACGY